MIQSWVVLLSAAFLVFPMNFAQANEAEAPVPPRIVRAEKNGITVEFSSRAGYTISVDGRPFSINGQLALVSPGWETAYYTYSHDPNRLDHIQRALATAASSSTDALRLEIPLADPNHAVAQTTQTFEFLPGRRLRISLESRPTTTTALTIENRVASIMEPWMAHRAFQGQLRDGSTTAGTVYAWAPSSKPARSTVLADFQRMQIDSPYGPVQIETTGTAPITLMDYRRNEWAEGQRYFWLGVLGSAVPRSGVQLQTTFTFPPARHHAQPPEKTIPATVISGVQTYSPPAPADEIIPTPKDLQWREENYILGKRLSIHLPQDDQISGSELAACRDVIQFYADRWRDRFGLMVTVGGPAMDRSAMSKARVEFVSQWDLPAFQSAEAYSLDVAPPVIQIKVEGATGLRHALASLEQLFRSGTDGDITVRGVAITDYPAMPFRGIHFFSGHKAEQLQTKMINEILAPLKINRLVYQVDYVEWDSQPEIHSPIFGMKKSEAKALADTARLSGIEVIPLINTFGHCEWLLQRPALRHLADNPLKPYAYDPSNPEVYRICQKIYEEAIELFQPRTIHIGHDEVTYHDFPLKPANKAVGATQLIIQDIIHYRNFLHKKGIRTMIWGDMFLGPHESPDACLAPSVAEARTRREKLPKDIVIADWHYRPADPEKYESLRIFADAGFDTVACTWHQPENIVNFAQRAATERQRTSATLGLLQTTWAGYSFDERSLRENFDQYAAYVLAAEAAWTGDADIAEKLDYRARFHSRWSQMGLGAANPNGWQLDLTAAANFPLDSASAAALAVNPQAFKDISAAENQWNGHRLRLPRAGERPMAVRTSAPLRLAGMNQPGPVHLALATATALPDDRATGRLVATLDDGSSTTVALRYGKNVFSIADTRQNLTSPELWKSPNIAENEGEAVIHRLELPVPAGRRITSLELLPAHPDTELLLFGVWGVGRPDDS